MAPPEGTTLRPYRQLAAFCFAQDLLTALDVRDDHLSEERGVRFTQDECRQSLLLPVLKLWDEYGRSW